MRDLHNCVKAVPALLPVAITATTSGKIIDLQGYEAVEFVVEVGIATSGLDASNKYTVTVQAGNTVNDVATPTTITDAATVTAAQLLGTPPTLDNAADDENVYRFGYVGDKRYVQLVFTETGTAAAPVSAVAILSCARHNPVPNQTT